MSDFNRPDYTRANRPRVHAATAPAPALPRVLAMLLGAVLMFALVLTGGLTALADPPEGDQLSTEGTTNGDTEDGSAPDGGLEDQLPQSGADGVPVPTLATEDTLALPLGFVFEVAGSQSYTISFRVPEGLVPVGFEANLMGSSTTELRVATPRRGVGVFDTALTDLQFPLEAQDLNADGTVTLRFALPPGSWCDTEGVQQDGYHRIVMVSDATLFLEGEGQPPSTVADFLKSGALDVFVNIPAGRENVLAEAALNMVAASALTLPDANVHLTVGGEAPSATLAADVPRPVTAPPFAQRRIELVEGTGETSTSITVGEDGVPTLTIRGTPELLSEATEAFASPGISLATSPDTAGLTSQPAKAPTDSGKPSKPGSLTFAEMGIQPVSLVGYGRQDAYIPISQGAFNRQLEQMIFTVEGVVSTTLGTVGTVEFLWDGMLVDSFVLDPKAPEFRRTFTIDRKNLPSGGHLVVRLQAVTADGHCIDESLLPPVRVDVNTETSRVDVRSGSPDQTSFQQFPQAFEGTMNVAFGVQAGSAQLSATGALVAAMQRATPNALRVVVKEPQLLLTGKISGLLVGVTDTQASRLKLPVLSEDPRIFDNQNAYVSVDVDQPFAVLQVVENKGRPLMLLGTEKGSENQSVAAALMSVTGGLAGTSWWDLRDDVRFAADDQAPVAFRAVSVVPEMRENLRIVAWVAAATLGALLLLSIVVGVNVRRKRKKKEADQRRRAQRHATETEPASQVAPEPRRTDEP